MNLDNQGVDLNTQRRVTIVNESSQARGYRIYNYNDRSQTIPSQQGELPRGASVEANVPNNPNSRHVVQITRDLNRSGGVVAAAGGSVNRTFTYNGDSLIVS